ncbi:hypothetical protein L6E12_32905 [Actinokineospora sp. PR83]|uniref:hypothetical protein n=1 Tax=Actinokineospora sp. PR83 TaxID=2884908 RepID=UPI0027E0B679|nr:hypothetical protein [Actinokineospora sp. PR83]MCG8920574.1 hypothetical protein [Actinokineospora sp. PR83]
MSAAVHPVVRALLDRGADPDAEVGRADWHSLWDALGAGALARGEAVALLASLSTLRPTPATAAAFARSLVERAPAPGITFPGAVNVVGTGGGPRTFNVSTAAAFVAAAAGTPVVKSGSRSRTSAHGSYDLLDRLGVPRTRSHAETAGALDRRGIAFTGDFVYPVELAALVRAVLPLPPGPLVGFVNLLGPLLAVVPVAAQVTGVADRSALPLLRAVADAAVPHPVWLCANTAGADELLGFADDTIDTGGTPVPVPRTSGSLAQLRPVPDGELVEHFLDVLAGRGTPTAVGVVRLNAAAVIRAADPATTWPAALAGAEEAMRSGAAVGLAQRERTGRAVAVARG